MAVEEPYEFLLLVKIKGHGTVEHQRKQAAAMKRTLDVHGHTDHEVFMQDNTSDLRVTVPIIPVDWPPVRPA